jgi:hypothetical protein
MFVERQIPDGLPKGEGEISMVGADESESLASSPDVRI